MLRAMRASVVLFPLLLWLASACGGSGGACDDGKKNGDETDVDCGGGTCGACAADGSCEEPTDCESNDCNDGACAEVACGDGRVQTGEVCDDGGESATCNANCTTSACGDGVVNATAGEECEKKSDEPWDRCGDGCLLGAGLDGTFGDTWEPLAAWTGGTAASLQEFVYAGAPYLYDFTIDQRYDIEGDAWQPVDEAVPWTDSTYWANGAVDSSTIWVARDEKIFRFDLTDEHWTVAGESVPDGNPNEGGAIFDGEGFIWYHGPDNDLVRYSPASDTYNLFTHDAYNMDETRMVYDPVTNDIVFAGFEMDRFVIYDMGTGQFHLGARSPEGEIHDNSCHDRSGGVYTGNNAGTKMFRYDIALDTWTPLPDLPVAHDNNSSCVVSQDGYLYYPDGTGVSATFYRLALGKR